MKQKLLNNFKLRALMLVAILCATFTGTAWGETVSFIFTGGSANCDAVSGTVSGISYATGKTGSATATAYNTTNGLVLYGVTSGGGYFNTTTAINGSITNISVTTNNKKNSPKYTVYGSTNGSTWTQIGEQTNGGSTASFDTSAGYTYVKIENTTAATAQLGVNSIIITYSVAAPAYTITAQSNNNSYGTVSLSGSVITASPASGYTYADPAYTVNPANSAIVAQEGNEFTVTPSANTTVTINFEAISTYTVTLGDDSSTLTEVSVGAGVELPSRNNVGDYTFAGWSTENVTEETTAAPTIITIDDTYHPTANITLYPVYTKTEGGSASTETSNVFESGSYSNGVITWSIAGVVSITQEKSDGGTAPNESYVSAPRWYSGNLITITPSVSINSIAVTATTANYATALANSTFSNATASAENTEVTITPTNGNSITISMGGQSRLSSLTVNYGGSTTYYTSTPSSTERVAQPTITIEDGTFVSSKLVTITTETPDAAIQYSTDGGNTWTNYSDPFSINATTTIQAKATKSGMDDSHVAEATFTKETVLEGLAGLSAQTNTSNASYYVNLTNAQVTYVTGNNGFMEDANAGIYVYSASPVLNKVYNGIFQVTYQVYNGLPELKAITAVEGTITDGSDKAATEVTLSTLTSNWNANLGRKVQVRATLTSNGDLADGYSLYKYDNGITTEGLKTYTLVGYPYIHSNSPQFNIISAEEVQLQDNSIIMVGPDYTIDVSVSGSGEVNMTSAQASHGTLQSEVVTASTTVDASKYNFAGNVLNVHDVTEGGVIVIRYWVDADAEYNAVELIVPIYLKANPTIAYDGETESTAYGTPYTIDTDLISGGDITLSSGNTAVATVDGLTITPAAVGSTTITINTAETNIWHAGTATFTLNVTSPAGKETAAPSSVVTTTFTDKNLNYEEGGIDWTASTDASSFESSNYARGVQFGAAVGQFTLTATGKNVTKVSMVLSTNGTGNAVQVNVDGESFTTTYGEIDPNNVLNLTSGMNKETVEFTGTAGNAVTITVDDSNKSVYIKSITLYEEADPVSVKLNGSGYATFCSEYPLDFSDDSEFSAWEITNIEGTTITFNQITGSVKGGTGLFLMGTPGATITLTSAASTTELGDNLLIGTLAPTYVEEGAAYGLKDNQFVPNSSAGTIRAGRAYILAGSVPSGVKAFTFVFEDPTTGISETRTVAREEVEGIFNLAGQRMSKMQKGINIVNGKKVLVK